LKSLSSIYFQHLEAISGLQDSGLLGNGQILKFQTPTTNKSCF